MINSEKCKCWKVPFEPPKGCFDYCAGKILGFANSDEIKKFLHFSEKLSENIYKHVTTEDIKKLSDFHSFLSNQEFEEVNLKIKYMDEKAVEWIAEKFKGEEGMTFNVGS